MILRNFRIGTRLAFGFGVTLAIMMVMVIGSGMLAERSRAGLAATLEAASAKESLASEMKALTLEQAAAMRNIGLHADIEGMQRDEDRARKLGKSYDIARDSFLKHNLQANERAILEVLGKLDRDIEAPFQQALGLSTTFRNEEAATVLLRELDPVIEKAQVELNKLIEIEKQAYRDALAESAATATRIAVVTYGVDLVVLVLAVLFAWTITRSITVPLSEAVGVARRVAAGDLTSRIEVTGNDEAAELLAALREMNDGLGRMVQQIRSGAETIAVGAGQVAAGNQSLSSRTEEHASSLEETASTLEEFTTTVKQNAEHARQASQLATTASSTAQRGGEIVGNVVNTMQDVTASSKRISDIIGVIDGISFQTNILALNAAVEAARAGEQGRGFAVVASEVRSLAQRSAASAKEIRGLIEQSVGKVEAGARLVEHAGKTMDELVTAVKRVAEIMTEIASASHEQSSGIEQINKAITQMDTVVQMNASIVEEATAAATSMAHQANALTRSVAEFRVNEDGAFSSLPPEPAPAAALARGTGPAAEGRRGAIAARREPAASAADGDDWKEF